MVSHPVKAQPYEALTVAGRWWFDHLAIPGALQDESGVRLRRRFGYLFWRAFEEQAKRQIAYSHQGELATTILIQSGSTPNELHDILRHMDLTGLEWQSGLQMWIYVTDEAVRVVARDRDDPFEQSVYPWFIIV